MMVYLLIRESGCYSDYSCTHIAVASTVRKAQELAKPEVDTYYDEYVGHAKKYRYVERSYPSWTEEDGISRCTFGGTDWSVHPFEVYPVDDVT